MKKPENIEDKLIEAEWKAIDSLSRYKFMQAGYWCAIWIHLARIAGGKRPNPFRDFVNLAREKRAAALEAGRTPKKVGHWHMVDDSRGRVHET